jgi:hypothetical protein
MSGEPFGSVGTFFAFMVGGVCLIPVLGGLLLGLAMLFPGPPEDDQT